MSTTKVLHYTHDALTDLFAAAPGNERDAVRTKLQVECFRSYFEKLEARTIVVEDQYIDHDFLEDFAAYYVRCFHSYDRYCTRLHFFRSEFDEASFARLFEQAEELQQQLRDSYLGFIVLRPIPDRIIGRTCLATYPKEDGRYFPTVHRYDASLFGLDLSVQTIPFQEQDRAVAACATSALWSLFNGTGHAFHHRIPSPAEITRRANASHPLDVRAFPADGGLTFVQMADAVRSCELEPLWLTDVRPLVFRAGVYAYLSAGIPLLLNGEFFAPRSGGERSGAKDPSESQEHAEVEETFDQQAAYVDDSDSGAASAQWRGVGVHAVTVVGYCLPDNPPESSSGINLRSSRISKLYCHDDGVGPFARMEFIRSRFPAQTLLSTSQAESVDNIGDWLFRPDAVLAPLYHKIRVPFVRIFNEIRAFDAYLRQLAELLEQVSAPNRQIWEQLRGLEWDVRLTTVNAYKAELLSTPNVIWRREVLESSLPRYLWLARSTHQEGGGFDVIFDATGLEVSNLCLVIVEHGSMVPALLRSLERQPPAALAARPPVFADCVGVINTLLAE